MPVFLNISTSPSRNRLWRSLIRLLLVSTVYIRSSKQRELFAAFDPNSPAILAPHGAAGVAGPRCPPWAANPTARPTLRTPTTIPETPERVSINCFSISLIVTLRLACRQSKTTTYASSVPSSREFLSEPRPGPRWPRDARRVLRGGAPPRYRVLRSNAIDTRRQNHRAGFSG